ARAKCGRWPRMKPTDWRRQLIRGSCRALPTITALIRASLSPSCRATNRCGRRHSGAAGEPGIGLEKFLKPVGGIMGNITYTKRRKQARNQRRERERDLREKHHAIMMSSGPHVRNKRPHLNVESFLRGCEVRMQRFAENAVRVAVENAMRRV